MEDYYERYIDKEHIINQACECILTNNSNSLKEEISLIKEKISSLSISDSWQDIVGDKFSEVITKFTESLTNIESSISSDFQGSEKLYLNSISKIVSKFSSNIIISDLLVTDE